MKKTVIVLCIVFLLTSVAFSQKGTTGWLIFRRAQSTKPKSVTAVAAVRGDLSGVFYNPSVLGTLQHREVFILTELGLAQDIFGGILYGQPLRIGKEAGISVGAVYYDAGKEKLYYIENEQEREQEVSLQQDILGIISYGQKITRNIFAGATFKYATSDIAQVQSASAFSVDLGMIYYLPSVEGLTVSLAGQNLGSATKFLDRAEELPMSVWFGTSYTKKFANSYLSVGAELPYIIKEKRTLPSIGIEYGFGQFAVNFGYRFGAEDALLHFGLGFSTNIVELGYAFIPATYLSHTHRVTFGFRF